MRRPTLLRTQPPAIVELAHPSKTVRKWQHNLCRCRPRSYLSGVRFFFRFLPRTSGLARPVPAPDPTLVLGCTFVYACTPCCSSSNPMIWMRGSTCSGDEKPHENTTAPGPNLSTYRLVCFCSCRTAILQSLCITASIEELVSHSEVSSSHIAVNMHAFMQACRQAAGSQAAGSQHLTGHKNSSPLTIAPHTHSQPTSAGQLPARSQVCSQPGPTWLSAVR